MAIKQPHTSVARAAGEGEEACASGKTTYEATGLLVLRGYQWPSLRKKSIQRYVSKPCTRASQPWKGELPFRLLGIGQKQHKVVPMTLF